MTPRDLVASPETDHRTFARVAALFAFIASVVPAYYLLLESLKVSEWTLVHVVLLLLPWPGLAGSFFVLRRPNEAITLMLFSAGGCGYVALNLWFTLVFLPAILLWVLAAALAWGSAVPAPRRRPP
jgi:hypothetical protein